LLVVPQQIMHAYVAGEHANTKLTEMRERWKSIESLVRREEKVAFCNVHQQITYAYVAQDVHKTIYRHEEERVHWKYLESCVRKEN
jgi:hypothetical protein